MKNYVILGIVALTMLLLAVPVMAINAEPIVVSGSIGQTLSITNNQPAFAFDSFVPGINEKDSVGTITVVSQWTGWTVAATTSPNGNGYMYNGVNLLNNPLEQYNYNAVTPAWVNVKDITYSGAKSSALVSTPMLESYRQNITLSDQPGSYTISVTYTVTAV